MGHWGVRSDEVDEASEALDAAFERVHGDAFDALMSDRDPLPFDEVHRRLAGPGTLAAAVAVLVESHGPDFDDWDDLARLALCGVVVRHAEFGVPIPPDLRSRAADWLEAEDLDWDPQDRRDARRRREIALLRDAGS